MGNISIGGDNTGIANTGNNNTITQTKNKPTGVEKMKSTPKWQLIAGLSVGVFFALIVLFLAVAIPHPTDTQFFIFRATFAIALAGVAAIIPGLLNVEGKYKSFAIRATGAIAVFVIVWFTNPPALIGDNSKAKTENNTTIQR